MLESELIVIVIVLRSMLDGQGFLSECLESSILPLCHCIDTSTRMAKEAAAGLHSIVVSHSGTSYPLSLPPLTTLSEIRSLLSDLTGVAPEHQKLISKGKTLSKESDAISSLIPDGSKILLVGAKKETISALVAENDALNRRYHASSTRAPAVKVRSTGTNGKTVMDLNDIRSAPGSAFLQIEVLKSCPHEDLRKERLKRLSQDEAVLGRCCNDLSLRNGIY